MNSVGNAPTYYYSTSTRWWPLPACEMDGVCSSVLVVVVQLYYVQADNDAKPVLLTVILVVLPLDCFGADQVKQTYRIS